MLSLLLSLSLHSKDDLLYNYCQQMGGEIRDSYQCPKSGIKLYWDFCVINKGEQEIFFDGCTGPMGSYKKLFYSHCINHDLCYHEKSSKDEKRRCDQLFHEQMQNSCGTLANKKKCLSYAKRTYLAVKHLGDLAYHCAKGRSQRFFYNTALSL